MKCQAKYKETESISTWASLGYEAATLRAL